MTQIPNVPLNDSNNIPQFGFGLWQVPNDTTESIVLEAFKTGYRLIDGAAAYDNEEGLGKAIASSGIPRDELFITTKLWNGDQGYDNALRAFDTSMAKLGLEQLDLYLIHWPSPHRDLYVESWKALIQLKKDGRVKSIGVSNFTPAHLQRLFDETDEVPSVNQIELHPRFQQNELRAFHAAHGIATESWSPLGQGKLLDDPTLNDIARKYNKTAAQVVLRWHLDQGLIVFPKSVTPARVRENFELFDFKLDAEDTQQINALDDPSGRIGPDPDTAKF